MEGFGYGVEPGFWIDRIRVVVLFHEILEKDVLLSCALAYRNSSKQTRNILQNYKRFHYWTQLISILSLPIKFNLIYFLKQCSFFLFCFF